MYLLANVMKWQANYFPEHLKVASLPQPLCRTVTSPGSQTDGEKLRAERRCWRSVLVAVVWISGHYSPFDSAITPELGDPAKMKWMFKEDHSLGKGVWVVMKQDVLLSCRASSCLLCFLRVDFAISFQISACWSQQSANDWWKSIPDKVAWLATHS